MNLSFFIFSSLILYVCVYSDDIKKPQSKKKPLLTRAANSKRTKLITTRVIGGYQTTIGEVGGFLVALLDDGDFFCGGSLVADLFVVTAAHCLVQRMTHLDDVTVHGGITSLKEGGEGVQIKTAIIPEEYSMKTSNMDVAVIKLKTPLVGPSIRTIKLCSNVAEEGDVLTVSGWGFTTVDHELQNIMSEVRTAEVPFFNRKKCRRIYKNVNTITKNMMCAGVLGEKDACQFDSGGPLVLKGELCGIVSFGVGCADAVFPGVYTDVLSVLPWIKKTVANL